MDYRGGPILAIDQATKTGLAFGVPGAAPNLETVNFRRDESDMVEDIYERALFYFADRFRADPPGLVAIERVVPPSGAQGQTNHATTLITVGVYAIIIGAVRCKSIPLRIIAVQSWRKTFLGNGRMPGEKAKREAVKVCERLGWGPVPDHNAAEAAGIWHHVCAQVAPYSVTTTHPALFAGRAA